VRGELGPIQLGGGRRRARSRRSRRG
jgi:hypothetical protein